MGNRTEVSTTALAGAIVVVFLTLAGPWLETITHGPITAAFGGALTTIVACILGLVLPSDLAARMRRPGNTADLPLPPIRSIRREGDDK